MNSKGTYSMASDEQRSALGPVIGFIAGIVAFGVLCVIGLQNAGPPPSASPQASADATAKTAPAAVTGSAK